MIKGVDANTAGYPISGPVNPNQKEIDALNKQLLAIEKDLQPIFTQLSNLGGQIFASGIFYSIFENGGLTPEMTEILNSKGIDTDKLQSDVVQIHLIDARLSVLEGTPTSNPIPNLLSEAIKNQQSS